MCTRGREARVCLQRNEAFTVSQTHTGQWLPVNESFIPVCLSPLTDTLWLWLSSAVYCLPATLQMRTSVPNSPQGKRCWSEANAMLSSWTKPRFRLLVGIFKNLRSCCVFPLKWDHIHQPWYSTQKVPVKPFTLFIDRCSCWLCLPQHYVSLRTGWASLNNALVFYS